MRSGTSFFNGTLYRKTFLRFWPIWALYSIQWLLLIPMPMLTAALRDGWYPGVEDLSRHLESLAQDVPQMLVFGGMSAAVAGVVCAMAVFSYLYAGRSACMMHALPLRRETLFVTQYLAGLSFLLLPHLVVFGLAAAVELSLGCLELGCLVTWLLAQSGMCLFFYSFAVFCAMFTGHLAALPIFYGILNFLAYVLCQMVNEVLNRFFFGFSGYVLPDGVMYLTPSFALMEACQWGMGETAVDPWHLDRPELVAIYAGVGVVFAVAALLVYRVRQVESAGDVVAVKVVRPLFRYGLAVCAGLTGGILTTSVLAQQDAVSLTFWVILWGVAGCFVGEMFLRKSFQVLKAWKGSAVLGLVLLVLCLSVSMDWYGYEGRVPDPDQVESVEVYDLAGAPYDSANGMLTLTDPEDIQRLVQIHRMATQMEDLQYTNSGQGDSDYVHLSLTYHLTDGSTLSRQYSGLPVEEADLEQEGTFTYVVNQLLSDRELVEQMYGFDEVEENRLVDAYLEDVWNTQNQEYETGYIDGSAQELWDAVKADFAQGTIGVRYLITNGQARRNNTCVTDLCFVIMDQESVADREEEQATNSYGWSITLTPNASHTLALLKELGALDDTHIAPTFAQRETYGNEAWQDW